MPDPETLATAVGEGMYARDRAAQALGITVDAIEPGGAVCRMTVGADMVQGHGTCHGIVFTLADTAFAYACNACNRATVALGAEITFVAPARAGALVALFRGTSYETRGDVVALAARNRT